MSWRSATIWKKPSLRKVWENVRAFRPPGDLVVPPAKFNHFEAIYRIIFELVSGLDMFFDFVIIAKFLDKGDIGYFSFSVAFALAPYLIA